MPTEEMSNKRMPAKKRQAFLPKVRQKRGFPARHRKYLQKKPRHVAAVFDSITFLTAFGTQP